MHHRLVPLLVVIFHLLAAENDRFEGYFQYPDGEKRIEIFAPFLAKDPFIYVISQNDNLFIKYKNYWPLATVIEDDSLDLKKRPSHIDLLHIDFPNFELTICHLLSETLKHTQVIYTTTELSSHRNYEFKEFKRFLETKGFTLLSHWFLEKGQGQALFIQNELFEQWTKVACYLPRQKHIPIPSTPLQDWVQFLQVIDHKSDKHSLEGIDFIYMINLDERPEKFALSESYLAPYGIKPYRFSAVNGWKLPLSTINQVGVKLAQPAPESWTGTTFEKIGFKEYRFYSPIQPKKTFFTWGMVRGSIGIILSHLSILQDALQSGYETIWIMEDDIEVLSDPSQISSLIEKLDRIDLKWDILFTDRDSKNKKGEYVPCRNLAFRPNFPVEDLNFYLAKFRHIDQDFSSIGMRFGAYSMILRRSGIEKIVKFYRQYSLYLPYDMDYWLIPDLRMYALNYDLVSTQPTAISDNCFSDLQN